jgi:hypothetical protein
MRLCVLSIFASAAFGAVVLAIVGLGSRSGLLPAQFAGQGAVEDGHVLENP